MKSRIKKNSWLQDITPSEYTVGIIKCTVRFLLILYLFYESILPAILLFPLWFLYMKEWMEEKAIGKEQEFRRQFRDSIQTMAGVLKQEKLTEEGTLVKLTAVLRYDEEKMSCEFYAHLFSTPLSKKEGVLKKISQEVEKADQEQREKDYLILPDQVDGRKLSWKPVKEMRAFGILLLGGVMIVFQFTAEKQKQKEQRKKEIRQMQFDYPQLINKFSLYIGAGMTVRRAWIQIVKEYDKEKHYLGERTVYEEMRYTMNELKNGRPESECYEAFGRRCESPVYRKFGMLLSQNLRKGTKGLTNLLQREAQEAFEERKNMAKKLGEEAGTKLMIPLFLMLAVVFVIVTVPAFLTIQI